MNRSVNGKEDEMEKNRKRWIGTEMNGLRVSREKDQHNKNGYHFHMSFHLQLIHPYINIF